MRRGRRDPRFDKFRQGPGGAPDEGGAGDDEDEGPIEVGLTKSDLFGSGGVPAPGTGVSGSGAYPAAAPPVAPTYAVPPQPMAYVPPPVAYTAPPPVAYAPPAAPYAIPGSYPAPGPGVDAASMARLAEENRRLKKLNEVKAALHTETTLEGFRESLLVLSMGLTRAERGYAMAPSVEEGSLDVVAEKSFSEPLVDPERTISIQLTRRVAEVCQTLVVADFAQDPRFQKVGDRSRLKLRSILAVPLVMQGKVLGALYLDHPHIAQIFGQTDREAIEEVAWYASGVFANLLFHRRKDFEIAGLRRQLQDARRAAEEKDRTIADLAERNLDRFMKLPYKQALQKLNQRYLKELLERNGADLAKASREAGVSEKVYMRLLKEHGLNVKYLSDHGEGGEEAEPGPGRPRIPRRRP